MGSFDGLSIPLNGWSLGDLAGHYLGQKYVDKVTGKEFRMCQLDTSSLGTMGVGTTFLVRMAVASGNDWIVTDDVSDGLNATYPHAVGFACAAVPGPSSSATVVKGTSPIYFWAQTYGPVETDPSTGPTGGTAADVVNDGTDIVAGDSLTTTSTDNTLVKVAAGTATAVTPFNTLGYSRTTVTGTTTSVFANCVGAR